MDVKQSYNRIAQNFSQTRSFLWKDLYLFTPYIFPGAKVLDVGCGNGRLLHLFEGMDISYTGIDQSENLLLEARKKHPKHHFVYDRMPELQTVHGTFDTIFCVAAFHHLENRTQRERCLKRLLQLLKPGGYLCMTNWNLFQLKYLIPSLKQGFDNVLKGKTWNDFSVPFTISSAGKKETIFRYYHGFTKSELDSYVRRSGFSLEKSFYAIRGKKTFSWFLAHNMIHIAQKRK